MVFEGQCGTECLVSGGVKGKVPVGWRKFKEEEWD